MSLQEKVRAAGVIGAGGAGFPTHVKLQGKAEYVLLNGAECEPLLRVDQQLMIINAEEIVLGLNLVREAVEAKEAIIGVKIKHQDVIEVLNAKISELNLIGKVSVKALPDVYPAGDEQVLVYELTGRVVPEMGIPIAVGCVVVNSETALNIYNANNNLPVTEKYLTIGGDIEKPITVKVPVGTPLQFLFKLVGKEDLRGYEVIDGGPMMGPLLSDKNGYVTKKTKGLLILKEDHSLIGRKNKIMPQAYNLNKTACEQCRMCTDLCPRYLLGHSTSPHKMVRAMGYKLDADENMTVAQTCCQCNLCEYFACPAGINPKMANVYYMNLLREKGIRHKPVSDVFEVRENRKYKMIPSKRLIARLELRDFDKKAPMTEIEYDFDIVGIPLDSHVGAKAESLVKVGDRVSKGQLIGDVSEGSLGASVHSSVEGEVIEVTHRLIKIRRL